VVVASGDFSAD